MNPEEELPEYDNSQEMEHARWKGAAASLSKSLDEGQITPEEHNQFYQSEIAPRLQRFDAMKQNTAKKQMDQQQQLAMQQHAHQTAMDHQATSFRARNVHDLIGTVTNPLTGKSRDLIENDKGDWTPIEYPEEDSGEEGGGEDGGMDYFPQTGGMEVGETGTSPSSHTMNLNVGGQQTQAAFGKQGGQWRQTGMQKFNQATGQWEDYKPQQQQPQQGQTSSLPSHGEMQEIWKRASDAIRLPQGPVRDHAVANLFDHMVRTHTTEKINKAARADRARAQAGAQAAKEKASAAKEDEKKLDKMHTDYGKAYTDARKEVQDEHKEWQKAGVESRKAEAIASKPGASEEEKAHAKKMREDYVYGHPQYLMDDDAKRNEIAKRAQEQIRGTHGWTDEHFKKIGVDTGEKKKEPAKEQSAATSAQPDGKRVEEAPRQIPKQAEPADKELHSDVQERLRRIGIGQDGKPQWGNATPEDLNTLHEAFGNPAKTGTSPEAATAWREEIARQMQARHPARAPKEKKTSSSRRHI